MHDLHKEGATRQQIEHALVTLPYVRQHIVIYYLVLFTLAIASCDD
jgi:hypothetical protein